MSNTITNLANFSKFLPLIVEQQFGRQKLKRTPEPRPIMDGQESVDQYDDVMTTKLAVPYAVALEVIYRARNELTNGTACDLASGPGHFTLMLATQLGYRQVEGVDLAEPMVELSTQNAKKNNVESSVRFHIGDVSQLDDIESSSVDLCCFTDASHHLPELSTVGKVLEEMDRVTRRDGLVFVMDLARLRTKHVTDKYVNIIGNDYVERGLPQFFEDFRDSMSAAWTTNELRTTAPTNTQRVWRHLVPFGLPTMQIIVGLPGGRKKTFCRRGCPWTEGANPVPLEMRWEWQMLRRTLLGNSGKRIGIPKG